jgi:hypothetical protein
LDSYLAAVIAHFLSLSPFTGLCALTVQIFSPTPGRHMTRAWDKSLIFDENENSGIWLSLGRNTCPWAEKVSTWNMQHEPLAEFKRDYGHCVVPARYDVG